jgi:membrane protease YdiL (CAAX protease family)
MHARNPSASYLSTSAIALEAGVLLAAAYYWSRNLWLPIGLHFSWNLTEGGLFGAAVSGTTSRGVLGVHLSSAAPDALTGGGFGPEASLVAVLACLVAAGVFIVRAKSAGLWKPWRFRMVLA